MIDSLILKKEANTALKAGVIVECVMKGMSNWHLIKTRQISKKMDDNTHEFRIAHTQIIAGQIWGYIEAPHVSLEDSKFKVLASAEGYVMYKRMGGVYLANALSNIEFLEKYKKLSS